MDIGTKISEMKNSRSTTRLKLKQNSNDRRGFPAFTGACSAGAKVEVEGSDDSQLGGPNLPKARLGYSSNAK
jgi:hypothetical protein